MTRYDDIINLPHHVSTKHKPMSMDARAAQFAPFAALSGHEEIIHETARLTEEEKDLSPDEAQLLSERLMNLIGRIKELPKVKVTYFCADPIKPGGVYVKVNGYLNRFDETENRICLDNIRWIPLRAIHDIEEL